MTTPTPASSALPKARQRLISQYHRLRSWHRVAERRGVNVRYVYEYATKGIVPSNRSIQRALGIPRIKRGVTPNQLLQLPIQDMPGPLLAYALENRMQMTA